ncbi:MULTISPECIES: aminodeoxychorismate synthase component I [Microbacterium]|uniref:aminodeoxychorismate synthase component I n=1 Tax=Microbacterium TaxID=33882 RepID=UPI00217E2FE3|nr:MULTISPECIES: aminodeoxychorismate synthase component I [Microbacterium]
MPAPSTLSARPIHGWGDPENLFVALCAGESAAFWLDAGSDAARGWSILGSGVAESDADVVRETVLAAPGRDGDADADAGAPLPAAVPFRGGWVGWLDYEDGAARAGAPTAPGLRVPSWIAVHRAVAIDHERRAVWALAEAGELDAWSAAVERALDAVVPPPPAAPPASASARHTVPEYVALVERCREAIRCGDAYQLCLTTRFTVADAGDPIHAYRRLRRATPSHHGGFLRIGDRCLASASPEQFLEVAGGVVRTSPIKGTRPRGATPAEDDDLARELRASEKERAENVMIVDLMRNDLSHIGQPGSVRVERLWEVESYPAVHQLVSTVSARLRPGVTFGELCDAAFPAGSMTGAPKLSAMTILHELERGPRGVYSGCFGHVGLDGTADLAMVIRSIVFEGDEAYVGAGGGITWLSDAAAEAAEVATKARAPLAALGATLPPDWAPPGR